jgi:hypothetical protein
MNGRMRPFWLMLALIFGGRVHVTARVLYTETFGRWGGAMPTAEERARWDAQNAQGAKPKPYASLRLLLRPGKRNRPGKPVAEVTSDANGRVSLSLAPGDYCVVSEPKRTLTAPGLNIDVACYEDWFAHCDAVWHVTDAPDQTFSISFQRANYGPSSPCYRGPSPPSAAPRH